jgi:hypothetical protein
LSEQFRGSGFVDIENIIRYVMSDQTDYHSGQIKQRTLKPMELEGLIEAQKGTRNRKNTYPAGCKLKFL